MWVWLGKVKDMSTVYTCTHCHAYTSLLPAIPAILTYMSIYTMYITVPTVVTHCYSDGYFELSNSIYTEGRSPDASIAFSVEARIDYCFNQTLHGVCDVGWSDEDAAVACQYLYGEGVCKSKKISKILQELCIIYQLVFCLHCSK